jgi:hypothetical protein
MLDLAVGGGGLVADQRPQPAMDVAQEARMFGPPALSHRHVDLDDVTDASGTARQHDDAVGKPRRLLEIVRHVDPCALLARPDR